MGAPRRSMDPQLTVFEGGKSADASLTQTAGVWSRAIAVFERDLQESGYSAFTIRDYKNDVWHLATLVNARPEEINAEHVVHARRHDVQQGIAVRTRRRRASAWSLFRRRLLATAEDQALLAKLSASDHFLAPQDRLLMALTALAGLRPAEITALQGRDINLRAGVLRARLGSRLIPMHPVLIDAIRAATRERPLQSYRPLLAGPQGHALGERTIHGRFQRIVKAMGIVGLKPAELRRGAARRLRAAGTPSTLVRAFLGLERDQPLAPRRGAYLELGCMRERILQLL